MPATKRKAYDIAFTSTLQANLGEIRNAFNKVKEEGGDLLTFMSSCVITADAVVRLDQEIQRLRERVNELEQGNNGA